MSEGIRRETPLVQFLIEELSESPSPDAGVRMFERQFLGHIDLRGDPQDQAFLRAVEGVLGCGLPLEPNTVGRSERMVALWLGPNEWLLLTPPDHEGETIRLLRDALGDIFSAVNDLSGGQTVINLQGIHARDVLSKGCTLDLHPRVFGPGCCAQTHISKTNATIWFNLADRDPATHLRRSELLREGRTPSQVTETLLQLDSSPSFDIIVRRSFGDYLARWIKDASQEYGLAVIPQPTD